MNRLDRELIAMRRAVALGKINAFVYQAAHLAELVHRGAADYSIVIDALWECAEANSLTDAHGPAFVQSLLADAFGLPNLRVGRAA